MVRSPVDVRFSADVSSKCPAPPPKRVTRLSVPHCQTGIRPLRLAAPAGHDELTQIRPRFPTNHRSSSNICLKPSAARCSSITPKRRNCAPRPGESFDLEDVRKDEECTDTVGIHLRVDDQGKAHFRVSLGPEVQTLTRAMTSILCKGLEGSNPGDILDLEADFVPRIIGADLIRQRSQTVYYVLGRMKGALTVWRNRKRVEHPGQEL